MRQSFDFKEFLAPTVRFAWPIEDVLPEGTVLDFGRDFLPNKLARTNSFRFLTRLERRALNQIRGHEYLAMLGRFEGFVLPFLIDHAAPRRDGEGLEAFARRGAIRAGPFDRFHRLFTEGFGVDCASVGPPEALALGILGREPTAIALVVLQLELSMQRHFLESLGDDSELDPLVSLLVDLWRDAAPQVAFDAWVLAALAGEQDMAKVDQTVDDYLEIIRFIDRGLAAQTRLNLDALERATGRRLNLSEWNELEAEQHQALRWTYIGAGMTHPQFTAVLAGIPTAAGDRIARLAPAFR